MKYVKTLSVQSGHTLWVGKLDNPGEVMDLFPLEIITSKYTDFYVVRNWSEDGSTFFYIAKGYHSKEDGLPTNAAREIHVWYRNGKMWNGYGFDFLDAINCAQRDGWLSATR